MKTIVDHTASRNPIRIPDQEDVKRLERVRDEIAAEVRQLEELGSAKQHSPEYQKILLDSYSSLQLIERTVMRLDPARPDFLLTFASMQGRWRERLALTEEMSFGKRRTNERKSVLGRIVTKLETLNAKLHSLVKP